MKSKKRLDKLANHATVFESVQLFKIKQKCTKICKGIKIISNKSKGIQRYKEKSLEIIANVCKSQKKCAKGLTFCQIITTYTKVGTSISKYLKKISKSMQKICKSMQHY